MGVSLKDITSTFGGFRTAAVLGGATAAEASAAFTQLSQALGSGALRGDEFRSIAEQAPLVLQAISDETGIAAGDLKEYAAQGLLTSDIVIKALKRIEAEGADRLAQALGGPAAKIKDFQNKVQDLQVAFTESAIPAITDSIKDLGTVIKQLEPLIRGLGTLLAGVARAVGNVVENVASGGKTVRAKQLALQAATLQTNAKFGTPGFLGRSAEAQAFFDETLKREESRRLAIARGAVPGQLPPSAADIGPTPKGTSPIKLQPKKPPKTGKTPEEIAAENLLKLKQKMAISAEKEMAASQDVIRGRQQELQTLTLTAQKGSEFAEFTQRVRDLVLQGVPFSEAYELEDGIRKQQQIIDKQQQINSLYEQAGQTIKDGIVNSLLQAKSATEALSGVLNAVSRQLMNFALGGFGGSKKGSGSGILGAVADIFRANGGPVAGGRSYIVGERGPEVFTPGVSGGITPNSALGGANVTVNVDASGSSVEGNADQASQLGKAIGVAVQQELIKQKRPGGLLAS